MRFARRSRRFLFAATVATALLGSGVAAAAPTNGDLPAHPAHADSADPALVSVNVLPAQSTSPNSYNGLAPTPPMGFNDWNAYGCNINEDVIKQTANAMATNHRLGIASGNRSVTHMSSDFVVQMKGVSSGAMIS